MSVLSAGWSSQRRKGTVFALSAALLLGGGWAAYSSVLGSPEYRLGVAASNTFRNPGYNVTVSTQVSTEYMQAAAPEMDFTSMGLPGIQSAADAAAAISNISVTMARGSNDVINPKARFAISYGKSTLLDFRIVKRTAYLRINPAALAKQSPMILPSEAISMMRSELRTSVAKASKGKRVSPAMKSYNYRALQLFDGKTVAMPFASNTAAGRKWNRLMRPATNPQLTGVQQATAALMQALRESLAGHTTVVDLDDDTVGDKMSVTFDVPGLMTALKPQLLEIARQQATSSGATWDEAQESASFDQSLADVPATLSADVWVSGDYIKQVEIDLAQFDDPATGLTLPAKGLVLRLIFNRGSVTAPTKVMKMSPKESNIAMNSLGSSALGFFAAANSGLPLGVRPPGVYVRPTMPSFRELTVHTSERALVWRDALAAFVDN